MIGTRRIVLPGALWLVALLVAGRAEAAPVNIDGLIVTHAGVSWTFLSFDAARDVSPAQQDDAVAVPWILRRPTPARGPTRG